MKSELSFYHSTESEVDTKLFLKANDQKQKNPGLKGARSYDSAILERQFSVQALIFFIYYFFLGFLAMALQVDHLTVTSFYIKGPSTVTTVVLIYQRLSLHSLTEKL